MKRLAVISTHPIQYYAPIFRLLNERKNLVIKVFYTWEKDAAAFDIDFGRVIKWDIPLLEGYDHEFVPNRGGARRDFFGVKNPDLVKKIEEWGTDCILVIGWNFYSHLRVMRYFKKKKKPVFFRGDSTLLNEKPGLRRLARRIFLRQIYRHVDKALYVGTFNKIYYVAHGLTEDQLVFAPHAVDNCRFRDVDGYYEMEAQKMRQELGISREEIVILFAGKFQAIKAPELLMDAFLELSLPNLHLVMVGNGEMEAILREKAADCRRIHFVPFQNQSRMPVVYRIADIFCLPSVSETWGLAVNEAMACGVPVIVSDRCGCSADIVRDGVNGFTFASNHRADLVNKIEKCISRPLRIRQMGDAAYRMIQDWSFTHIAEAVEEVTNLPV